MTKQYETLAKKVVDLVGGASNIHDVYHCQTRLRFHLIDDQKADRENIQNLEGVTSVLEKGGTFQVVIGPQVADVFEEVEKYAGPAIKADDDAPVAKVSWGNRIIDFVSSVFQPIIPALSGAGMIKALLALLVVFNAISVDSQTYVVFNMFADGVFYFLPILLAYTEAQKLKCNPIIAMSVAVILINPTWTQLVTAGKAVHLFNVIPLTLTSYAYSVIPIILIIFCQRYVERLLKRWIPKTVELVFVPMLTIFIMGTLSLFVLGPIGAILGSYLANVFTFLSVNASWAPALIIGGLLPIMVMFGVHNAIAPLGVMQLASTGFDSIFGPGCLVSNMAQATAGLVVALRTNDKRTKTVAVSGAITGYMGITEPILYGVNLPKKYPLVAAMIGGASGGLYAGLTHAHRFATGSSGLPAVLLYIGNNTMQYLINILIAMAIAVVVSGVLTLVLSFKYETKPVQDSDPDAIISPIKGESEPIAAATDEAFATGGLGQGIVIKHPLEGKVYAPISGTVMILFPTLHAIGIVSDTGVELLIHIGIDTVELQGKYFNGLVKQGDHVDKGQLLITFDQDKISAAGYSTETMMVITNSSNYQDVELSQQNEKLVVIS